MTPLLERPALDLVTPHSWHLGGVRKLRGRGVVFVALFGAQNWTFGVEIIRGHANGAALVLGPLWLGVAIGPLLERPQ